MRQIAQLPDLIGEISEMKYRPSGIQVGKMRGEVQVFRYNVPRANGCAAPIWRTHTIKRIVLKKRLLRIQWTR